MAVLERRAPTRGHQQDAEVGVLESRHVREETSFGRGRVEGLRVSLRSPRLPVRVNVAPMEVVAGPRVLEVVDLVAVGAEEADDGRLVRVSPGRGHVDSDLHVFLLSFSSPLKTKVLFALWKRTSFTLANASSHDAPAPKRVQSLHDGWQPT